MHCPLHGPWDMEALILFQPDNEGLYHHHTVPQVRKESEKLTFKGM